jgi:signal transduction histidine kinase
MPQKRREAESAIASARADLDRALATLQLLADDDRKRISYSMHALSNYLMSVSTTLHVLRTKVSVRGDGEIKRLTDSLEHATSLMMTTARGVLAGTPNVTPFLVNEPARLSEIVEGVAHGYRYLARMKRLRIVTSRSGENDTVLTDSVAAGAVLDNLLSNAIKYSMPGAQVAVSTYTSGCEVICTVRDQGPGLSDADQERLFQRGVSLTPRPTAGESSTGYGLAIARDLTEALGGRLSCSSALGKGSCFTFALPSA